MKLLSTYEPFFLDQTAYHPYVSYLYSDAQTNKLIAGLQAMGIKFTPISSFDSYEKRYAGQSLEDKTLLSFRFSGWGDQLITSGLLKYIIDTNPRCRILHYCVAQVTPIWLGYKELKALPLPLPSDVAFNCDYHLLFENLFEHDSRSNQNNAYDTMFNFAGYNSLEIPDKYKRPYVILNEEEQKRKIETKYILVQLQASKKLRTYPAKLLAETCELLQNRFPDLAIVLVGLSNGEDAFFSARLNPDRFLNLTNKISKFRNLIPLVRDAELVICPDSSIGHVAGMFPDVPTISLWGPFDPQDRVKYYSNHIPLYSYSGCDKAPCHLHNDTPVKDICGDVEFCKALTGIEPLRILEEAERVL